MTTGFLYDSAYLQHDTGRSHPECADRLSRSIDYLQQQSWFADLRTVTAKPIDPVWLQMIHQPDYIRHVQSACENGAVYIDSPDVSISSRSFEIALLASGGVLQLADALITGKIDNGFALIRPPGHHAENHMALGFCLFNNIAITARYLQKQYGLDKIAIVDWDVHHGNGTQHSFTTDPSVFYISLHEYPLYPGTGAWNERGEGRGLGATLNCPQHAGATDRDYELAFHDKILPALHRFKPEIILISAGFDAHRADPLANVRLSTEFFGWMTGALLEVADMYANGRLLSMLEGGYDLDALPRCIASHLQVLSGYQVQQNYP
ncbi:MAG: histone deacetylase [Gammaproteobacteria bacterium]